MSGIIIQVAIVPHQLFEGQIAQLENTDHAVRLIFDCDDT